MPRLAALVVAAAFLPAAAMADPWKDESGHGRYGQREYKQEWRDGNCKYERKWEKNGEYKEEVKCDGPRQRVEYHPYPVAVPAPLPAPVEPSITVTIPVR